MASPISSALEKEFKVVNVFAGIGGLAVGFKKARYVYKGIVGKFRNLCGIDVDETACRTFEMLTGAPAVRMDLFAREQYIAWHGHEPPADWKEVTPEDIRRATGGETPHILALSPPCKGFSGLLPSKAAESPKYQALNKLAVRGIKLCLEAFADDLPCTVLFENVPRIASSRGAALLNEVKELLSSYGYVWHEGTHNAGSYGGLAQNRKRYLMIARLPEKLPLFIYKPYEKKVKAIGEVLGSLPLPDDPKGGRMHRLPRLKWNTLLRLALIPAGGDWRDLEKLDLKQYRLTSTLRAGSYGVQEWDKPAATVIGSSSVGGSYASSVADPRVDVSAEAISPEVFCGGPAKFSHAYKVTPWDEAAGTVASGGGPGSGSTCVADKRTANRHLSHYKVTPFDKPAGTITGATHVANGATCVADERVSVETCEQTPSDAGSSHLPKVKLKHRDNRHPGVYRIIKWAEAAPCVTGSRLGSGMPAIADPRLPEAPARFDNKYRIEDWGKPARTVTGIADVQSGAPSIADPRCQDLGFGFEMRNGSYAVQRWDDPAKTVCGSADVHAGPGAVADPRPSGWSDRPGLMGVLDWNRPSSTITATMRASVSNIPACVSDPRLSDGIERDYPIIIALDGTWHRPLSTLELLVLQGFDPVDEKGDPIVLAGTSDSVWREHIGNAVPPPSATAIAEFMLSPLLANLCGDVLLGNTEIWVDQRNTDGISISVVEEERAVILDHAAECIQMNKVA